jgi:hypothetical protein
METSCCSSGGVAEPLLLPPEQCVFEGEVVCLFVVSSAIVGDEFRPIFGCVSDEVVVELREDLHVFSEVVGDS